MYAEVLQREARGNFRHPLAQSAPGTDRARVPWRLTKDEQAAKNRILASADGYMGCCQQLSKVGVHTVHRARGHGS